MKRIFAVLLVLTLLSCTFVIPAGAKNTANKNNDIEIIIHDDVSEETREKIERYFANGEPSEEDFTTYGIKCVLLGHDIRISSVSAVTHKASATSPRCLEKTYDYEECTRCDYEKATLISKIYIVCCK